MKLEAMQAVYSYFFPESRKVINGFNLPDELFFVSTPVAKAKELLEESGFPDLEITKTLDDKIDLDMIHEPIIEKIKESYAHIIPALNGFKHSYPMSGSSQGIFHLLAELRQKGIDKINVFEGEYEGYKEYGKCLGLETREQRFFIPAKDIPKGYWFISNPSARNGNIIPDEKIIELCEAGHKIILDLAYVGMTKQHAFSLEHENIIGAVMSMSKPYGVFRHRIGGFTFTREPVQSLYANKWFKDVPALFASLALVNAIPPGTLYKKYAPIQREIIGKINRTYGLGMKPSDVFLLGYIGLSNALLLSEQKKRGISRFMRGSDYRFCLTPYFEEYEKEKRG